MLYMLKSGLIGLPFLWTKHRAKKTVLNNEKNPDMYSPENLHKKAYRALGMGLKGLDIKVYHNSMRNVPLKPCIFYPNHVSQFDPMFIYYLMYKFFHQPTAFIAKKELEFSSMRYFFKLTSVLFLDRSNLRDAIRVFDEAKIILNKKKISFCLFPEGTRGDDENSLLDFKPGAFKLAYDAHCPIVPVTIFNSKQLESKMRFKKARVYVYFHPAIEPKNFLTSDTAAVSKKVYDMINDTLQNKQAIIKDIQTNWKTVRTGKDATDDNL